MGPRGVEPLPYGFEDRYDIHFTKDPLLAESIGIEPIHPLLSDGLAIRCLTARPTLRCYLAEAVRFELTIQLPVCLLSRQMPSATRPRFRYLEEKVRFELTDLLQPLVFKTSAIDHSATLPLLLAASGGLEPPTS